MKNFDYIQDTSDDVLTILNNGDCINYGPLSLCRLRRFSNRDLQIDCDCKELHFSELYEDFTEAFQKFLELRKRLRALGYIIDFKEKVKPVLSGSVQIRR